MASTLVNSQKILHAKRWDFEYFDPEYIQTIELINQSGWPVKKLSELVSSLTDGQHGYLTHTPVGIPLLRTSNVFEYELRLDDVRFIAPEVHAEIKRSQLRPGDVLLTTIGSIGLAAVVDETLGEANINQNLVKMTPIAEVNSWYLSLFFNSRVGRVQIERAASKSVVPIVNYMRLKDILIPLPPRPVQDHIASVIQDAYARRQEKISKAEGLRESIENYILEELGIAENAIATETKFTVSTSKLDRFDVRYFLPLYEKLERQVSKGKYPTKSLGQVCTKINNGLTPARAGYTDNGFIVIKVASLTNDWQVDWNKVAFTSKKFFSRAKKAHTIEDDLLILSASHQLDYIGKNFGLVRNVPNDYVNRCMIVGELIIVRANRDEILPDYLLTCFVTKHIQFLVNRMTRGQTAHLYADDLKELRIPVPPKQVQEKIVIEINNRLNKAAQLRKESETIITEAKARVEGMILGEVAP